MNYSRASQLPHCDSDFEESKISDFLSKLTNPESKNNALEMIDKGSYASFNRGSINSEDRFHHMMREEPSKSDSNMNKIQDFSGNHVFREIAISEKCSSPPSMGQPISTLLDGVEYIIAPCYHDNEEEGQNAFFGIVFVEMVSRFFDFFA